MTLSPEQRAWAVACDINSGDDGYEMAEKIAPAIREACNEKLEEARLIASAMVPEALPKNEFERGVSNTACAISIEIDRLKLKDKSP
jgi:hypothetical protein